MFAKVTEDWSKPRSTWNIISIGMAVWNLLKPSNMYPQTTLCGKLYFLMMLRIFYGTPEGPHDAPPARKTNWFFGIPDVGNRSP